MSKKVLVGMSGGVDSGVVAFLLKKQGYDVVGATMKLFDGNDGEINDAKNCCKVLKIEHIVLDFSEQFKHYVMDNFCDCYQNGLTPNPCIVCNKKLKFGEMLDYALKNDFDYIATGHYCKVKFSEEFNRMCLRRSTSKKDQSYVLYSLTQNMLKHILMPLADYAKEDIRHIAEEIDLPIYQKPESQDICFVKDGSYKDFLRKQYAVNLPGGNFINKYGEILGKHTGIINYTIGQRKGLNISFGKPMFVVGINVANNTVVLGENEDLFSSEFVVKNVNLILFDKLNEPLRATVKIRYSSAEAPATLIPIGDNEILVKFDQPQRAITAGQSAVFYYKDFVLGGGIIK